MKVLDSCHMQMSIIEEAAYNDSYYIEYASKCVTSLTWETVTSLALSRATTSRMPSQLSFQY